MLFGQTEQVTAWWVAGALGVATVLLAFLHVADRFKQKRAEWRKTDQELDAVDRKNLTDEQREADRVADVESDNVIERLKIEIGEQAAKIAAIESRERACFEERANDKLLIRILAVWAKRQKNPPPIPDDILEKYLEGSGVHPPLPPPPKNEEGGS